MAKPKTFRQLMAKGSDLVHKDAKQKRDNLNRSQFELDRSMARSPKTNRWGFPTGGSQ